MPDAPKKTCFIIMPISAPETHLNLYRDGAEHFMHVLDCLFIPAVKAAGYKPIKPIAEGSDLIQAGIIQNLETADMVLCDISSLNPNVFFEFGIRTSLNKPVAIVKDELTKKVPFDTGILNHQEYKSALDVWDHDCQVAKIAQHIGTSDERSKGQNALWKYFGLRSSAKPFESTGGSEERLEYLAVLVNSLNTKVDYIATKSQSVPEFRRHTEPPNNASSRLQRFVHDYFEDYDGAVRLVCAENGDYVIWELRPLTPLFRNAVVTWVEKNLGVGVTAFMEVCNVQEERPNTDCLDSSSVKPPHHTPDTAAQ